MPVASAICWPGPLEQALDGELSGPVRARRLVTIGDNLFNDVGRVDNVSDALTISLVHP